MCCYNNHQPLRNNKLWPFTLVLYYEGHTKLTQKCRWWCLWVWLVPVVGVVYCGCGVIEKQLMPRNSQICWHSDVHMTTMSKQLYTCSKNQLPNFKLWAIVIIKRHYMYNINGDCILERDHPIHNPIPNGGELFPRPYIVWVTKWRFYISDGGIPRQQLTSNGTQFVFIHVQGFI